MKIPLVLAAATFFFATVAFAGKTQSVKVFYDSVLPNGQTLKAGNYAIQVDEATHKVQFLQKGKVIAEAPCNCIEEGKKFDKTLCIFRKDEQGKQTLQQMQVGGSTKTIVLQGQGL